MYLPDVLTLLRADGRVVAAHVVDDPTLTLGVNDRVDLAEVTALAQRRILEHHMRNGVTIIDPAHDLIDAGVAIGADTVIEPGTTILAARPRSASAARSARSRPSSTPSSGTACRSATPGSRAPRRRGHVGPFAYLRPGAILRARAKAGTFVEIKNSDIGEGTKVPHLSLHRRRRHRAGHQPRRGDDHGQLQRQDEGQEPDDDRRRVRTLGRHDAGGAGRRSATMPTPPPGRSITEDVPAGRARRRARAPDATSRATRTASRDPRVTTQMPLKASLRRLRWTAT